MHIYITNNVCIRKRIFYETIFYGDDIRRGFRGDPAETKTNARKLRLAICNAKKSGDSAVCRFASSPRPTFVFVPDILRRSLARVTMNHLASRVRHRLLIESFRRKQDGNLSPKLFAKLERFIGEIIYLRYGRAVVSRRPRTSRFSSRSPPPLPSPRPESALTVNMNLQLIP